ncbi:MAG: SDR family oxidoreductase [Myxococcales bacterium]|nr:SDR family oxidoreductase [Myxococcales bacterium]
MDQPTRRFFLTGCASGIGLHLCDTLQRAGHRVWATDIDIDGLRQRARERTWPEDLVTTRALDIADARAWEPVYREAVAALGAVDVHMNIAGYLAPSWICDARDDDIDRHFDVNVKGVVLGTREAARHMTARGEGHILNFASLAALAPIPGLSLYSASKYAVRAYSLAAAMELRARGVAVTVICPDAVKTPMLDKQLDHEETELTFSGAQLSVEDIARLVIERALPRRPLQLSIPRSRAVLARVADLAPRVAMAIQPRLAARGRARQRAMKAEHERDDD